MVTDSDLLFVVLAARLGFTPPVPAEQAADLEDRLAPAARMAVRAALAAHLAMHGGSAARALDSLRPTGTAARVPSGVRLAPMGAGPAAGIARLLEAWDARLDPDEAPRLLLNDLPQELALRFIPRPGEAGVAPFLKRFKGRDLGSLLGDIARGDKALAKRWTLEKLLRVFETLCLGLAYAHAKGVVHRDLKPAHILVGDDGEVLIADWGAARSSGGPGEAEAGADMDALGAILHSILTLRSPADGPPIPANIQAIAVKALAPRRELRYASAEALHQELCACLNEMPSRGRKKPGSTA
ncbi:MAG: protein kinase [Planctomycetota bacterium]